MQSKVSLYAQYLVEQARQNTEKECKQMLEQFFVLLKERGDFKLARNIVREAERRWRSEYEKEVRVLTNTPLSEQMKTQLEQALGKKGYTLSEETHAAMGDGISLVLGTEYLIDNTIPSRLKRLWNQIA